MPISDTVQLGKDVAIFHPDLVNLYGCIIDSECRLGTFVEIQRNARVGKRCKISSHSFICEGVTLEEDVFIGHGVMFTNDLYPRASSSEGKPLAEGEWKLVKTTVGRGASIGSNATILAGVHVGRSALVGAGAVVTHDVPDYAVVAGVPARQIGDVREERAKS